MGKTNTQTKKTKIKTSGYSLKQHKGMFVCLSSVGLSVDVEIKSLLQHHSRFTHLVSCSVSYDFLESLLYSCHDDLSSSVRFFFFLYFLLSLFTCDIAPVSDIQLAQETTRNAKFLTFASSWDGRQSTRRHWQNVSKYPFNFNWNRYFNMK